MVFSIDLFTSSNVLYETLKKHGFTKMAVSLLIMVRFLKLKIWHTQENSTVLLDPPPSARASPRARDVIARASETNSMHDVALI